MHLTYVNLPPTFTIFKISLHTLQTKYRFKYYYIFTFLSPYLLYKLCLLCYLAVCSINPFNKISYLLS